MRTRHALLALPLAACAGEPLTGHSDQAVIGGEVTPQGTYAPVGSLYLAQLGSSCTGTLIRPDVVLTAAHCVDPLFLNGEVPGFTLDNDARIDAPVPAAVVPGLRTVQHEEFDLFSTPSPGVGLWYDIGLLWLASPIDTAAPMQVATPEEAVGLVAGLDLEIVGYGRTDNATDDYGVKNHAIAELIALSDSEIQISSGGGTPQNCHGDSGGPAIVDLGDGPRIVGVVSRSATQEGDCDDGGIDTRPDYFLDWIEQQLDAGCGGACPDAMPEPEPDAEPSPEPDAGDAPIDGDDSGGCCSTGGGGGAGGGALALAVLGLVLRGGRRRKQ